MVKLGVTDPELALQLPIPGVRCVVRLPVEGNAASPDVRAVNTLRVIGLQPISG
jgi:hypothetical protein